MVGVSVDVGVRVLVGVNVGVGVKIFVGLGVYESVRIGDNVCVGVGMGIGRVFTLSDTARLTAVVTTMAEVMTRTLPPVIPTMDGKSGGRLSQSDLRNPIVAVVVRIPSEMLTYFLSPANLSDLIPSFLKC